VGDDAFLHAVEDVFQVAPVAHQAFERDRHGGFGRNR
jgi:hypothetical protein